LALDSVKNEGSKLIQVVHSQKEMKFYSFKAITDMVIWWWKRNSPLGAEPQVPILWTNTMPTVLSWTVLRCTSIY